MLMNMKDLLAVANRHNFAVPAFNVGINEILKSVMDCVREKRSPVILAFHPLEMEFLGECFMAAVRESADAYRVPCCIHLDHGSTLEHIYKAIRAGFTSVMIDASSKPFEENVAITKAVVKICHKLDVSVEAELGSIGSTGNDFEGGAGEIVYTDPVDAARFVEETGCDCLAIAIGTAHGIYPPGFKPELRLDILREVKKAVNVPLVLHGGSANRDSEIAESVKLGVSKINISSDTKDAYYQQLRKTLAADPRVREPFEVCPEAVTAMHNVIRHKIDLFQATGKIELYNL